MAPSAREQRRRGSYNSTDDCTLYFFNNLICRSPPKTSRINPYDFHSVFHYLSLPHCLTNLYLADVFFSLEPKESLRLEKARALRRARTRARNIEHRMCIVGYDRWNRSYFE